MLFKDDITKENLLKYYIQNETNAKYREGIKELKSRGYIIKAAFRGNYDQGLNGLSFPI